MCAQKNHFIAIQSENKQPYYVKVATGVFNSSPTGHIIIPKFADSTYIITIGFSKSAVAEQQFSISITKDIGFILRIGKDNRLFLSNSQTAQVIAPVKQQLYFVSSDSPTTTTGVPVVRKTNESFSKLMSQVVNDSGVMENMNIEEPKKEVARTEPVKISNKDSSMVAINNKKKKDDSLRSKRMVTPESNKPVIKNDSSSIALATKKREDSIQNKQGSPAIIKPDLKNDSSAVAAAAKKKNDQQKKSSVVKAAGNKEINARTVVKKLAEQKSDTSLQLSYEDIAKDGKKDTINIIIPLDSIIISPPLQPVVIKDNSGHKEITSTTDKRNKENISANANSSKDSAAIDTTKVQTIQKAPLFRPITQNNNCKIMATDYDVDKLRVKMLAIEDEDDKISTAKKVFKVKCFTTNQIKALSEVFDKDAGKYKLFDAAYSYVSDPGNFSELQSLLKDDYYVNRFKAMIK